MIIYFILEISREEEEARPPSIMYLKVSETFSHDILLHFLTFIFPPSFQAPVSCSVLSRDGEHLVTITPIITLIPLMLLLICF